MLLVKSLEVASSLAGDLRFFFPELVSSLDDEDDDDDDGLDEDDEEAIDEHAGSVFVFTEFNNKLEISLVELFSLRTNPILLLIRMLFMFSKMLELEPLFAVDSAKSAPLLLVP